MSRKWERMVRKNSKIVRQKQAKNGNPDIAATTSDGSIIFKGRSWMLPMLLFSIGVFALIVLPKQPEQDVTMSYVTGASYIVLALLMYWARRPFLKIGKTTLTSRRFGGDKVLAADQIQDILFVKDTIIVTLKPKGKKWAFSKGYHRFPIDTMKEKLTEFATKNKVELKVEA